MAQGFRDADDTITLHLCFQNKGEVWVTAPEVDGGQRPATPVKDTVGNDGIGEAYGSCLFTRPVLENAGCAADGDAIRPFGTQIVAVDERDRLTKGLRSTLRRNVWWQVVVHGRTSDFC
jgi:hypothetical protein